jgi:hypothetical protein
MPSRTVASMVPPSRSRPATELGRRVDRLRHDGCGDVRDRGLDVQASADRPLQIGPSAERRGIEARQFAVGPGPQRSIGKVRLEGESLNSTTERVRLLERAGRVQAHGLGCGAAAADIEPRVDVAGEPILAESRDAQPAAQPLRVEVADGTLRGVFEIPRSGGRKRRRGPGFDRGTLDDRSIEQRVARDPAACPFHVIPGVQIRREAWRVQRRRQVPQVDAGCAAVEGKLKGSSLRGVRRHHEPLGRRGAAVRLGAAVNRHARTVHPASRVDIPRLVARDGHARTLERKRAARRIHSSRRYHDVQSRGTSDVALLPGVVENAREIEVPGAHLPLDRALRRFGIDGDIRVHRAGLRLHVGLEAKRPQRTTRLDAELRVEPQLADRRHDPRDLGE